MKIFKQKKDMSFTDITKRNKLKNVILWMLLLAMLVIISSSFKNKNIYVNRTIIVHDTIEQLIVMKYGLTEINVDRNGNIPTFCNNPGALRKTSIKAVNDLAIGLVQTPSGEFLHFANKEHGFKALEIVIKQVYWNNTIKEMLHKYAPSFENNTNNYITKLVKNLNCSENTLVKNCDIKKLILIIAEIEGFKIK